jgi:hypothetical protein
MQPQPGQLIRAPFLSAPAEVKKFEPRSGYYLLEVVLEDGQHTFKPLRITAEQLAQIQVLERNPVALTADAEDFFYLIEAHRIRVLTEQEVKQYGESRTRRLVPEAWKRLKGRWR